MTRRQRRTRHERRTRSARVTRRRSLAAAAGLALGGGLASAASAEAADFTVTNLNDNGPGSLRQSILLANSNTDAENRILFESDVSGTLNVGTTGYVAAIEITKPLEIVGPGADAITLNGTTGSYDNQIFQIDTDSGEAVTISGLTLANGVAEGTFPAGQGGAISVDDGDLTVRDAVLTGNDATYGGGAIYARGVAGIGADVTIERSTISGGSATGPDATGGAVRTRYADLTIDRSTVTGNQAEGRGGAIFVDAASLTIDRSTISGNTAGTDGGAVGVATDIYDQPALAIDSSTVTGNGAGDSGGGVAKVGASFGPLSLTSTIVAGNTASSGPDLQIGDPGFPQSESFDAAFSLIGDPGETEVNETAPGTVITGVDPQLGPLAANGGTTRTHALAPGSPAADKGNSGGASADQRGLPRPVDFPSIANAPGGDGADIGAFELQELPPPPPPPPNGGGPPPPTAVSNQFSFGKVRKNKRRGIAILRVRIPGPGRLVLRKNRKVKRVAKRRDEGGNVRLKVRPRGQAKRKLSKRRLRRSGKKRARVRVRARVTYRPTGGEPRTKSKRVRLVRKRPRRR